MTRKILDFTGQKPGLSIIIGENGVGKTRFLNDIAIALFGSRSNDDEKTSIRPLSDTNGDKLSRALYNLSQGPSGAHHIEKLNFDVKYIMPNFGRLEPRRHYGMVYYRAGKDGYVPLSQSNRYEGWLSLGVLNFISLWEVLRWRGDGKRRVILIDDIEQGLHPAALHYIAAMLKQSAEESRVIVTTHSPLLLNEFEPKDIVVLDAFDDEPDFRVLTNDDYADWLAHYRLGDLWLKNIIGGRP